MQNLKKCEVHDKIGFESLSRLFSKPYSKQMLELSFRVVNSEIFDRLDQESFFDGDDLDTKTYFDEHKSILYVKGEKVVINKQAKITNAHKILKHIFVINKDNPTDDYYFSEIAEDEFGDLEYAIESNSWRKYHTACQEVNKKVEKHTKEGIRDFLIFNTGSKGKVKLNTKHF
jgi:hypothetical protein